jgi:ATP-dependent Lhr-like helicase
MTVSSDLIYDVLRQHEPDHILLQAAFADAATGLIDVGRLSGFLQRIGGRIRHVALSRVSPLAVPVMLEIGRESIPGDASEALLREAVEELISEAMGHDAALKV